ncbi:hypothetical protein KL930_003066 [Ogataea haglerorum]|nr:hypothetical protein KL915_003642 [Ogataea haglerorum]KAG7704794.1 hypothetical protein KL950_003967 [Ogataea haglerorum]KAG7719222.1 hypothetical protein KL913_002220 [Ogataea haglerorum]KAG7719955.1 hypothetical protein KL949_001920 [Ogataea haglerorum]KAG7756314.1 hypothetical protein KL947_003920 [Ogataea haglerorum]
MHVTGSDVATSPRLPLSLTRLPSYQLCNKCVPGAGAQGAQEPLKYYVRIDKTVGTFHCCASLADRSLQYKGRVTHGATVPIIGILWQ